MTFLQYTLSHALGTLIAYAILYGFFKWHKPHVEKETIDL